MKKFRLIVLKIKRNIITLLLLIFTLCLVVFSSTNMQSAKKGLKLWANSIVPSLFPFFIATECLSKTNMPKILGKLLDKIMKPLFNVPGEGSFAMIMGWLSGCPIGAKIAVDFRNNNICTKEECERLLSFTNTSGPLFIIGTCGVSLFGNLLIGFLLFITHILGCITVGFIFKFWKKNKSTHVLYKVSKLDNKLQNISFKNLGEVLGESIKSATSSIFMIGGFVVLFSVIISIFQQSGVTNLVSSIFEPLCKSFNIPPNISSACFTGLFEITNGIHEITNIKLKQQSINVILTSFILGLGGISIMLQIFSIVSKSDLSIKPYVIGKIFHGIFSAFYTFLIIKFFPIFNFDL